LAAGAQGPDALLNFGTIFVRLRFTLGSVASHPIPNAEVTAVSFFNARSAMLLFNGRSAVKTQRFAGHHEAREALVLSIAGVTAIMVTAYLILMILY
jgi:hypothetical protein